MNDEVENVALYAVDSEYFDNDDPVKTKSNGDNKNRGIWPLPGESGVRPYNSN